MRLISIDDAISGDIEQTREINLVMSLMELEKYTFGVVTETTRMMLGYAILQNRYKNIDMYRNTPDNRLYMKIGDTIIHNGTVHSISDKVVSRAEELPMHDSIYHTVPSNRSELYRYLRSIGYINDDNTKRIMGRVNELLQPNSSYETYDLDAICCSVTKMKALRVYDILLSIK
jgi:hypothetical protein